MVLTPVAGTGDATGTMVQVLWQPEMQVCERRIYGYCAILQVLLCDPTGTVRSYRYCAILRVPALDGSQWALKPFGRRRPSRGGASGDRDARPQSELMTLMKSCHDTNQELS